MEKEAEDNWRKMRAAVGMVVEEMVAGVKKGHYRDYHKLNTLYIRSHTLIQPM